MSDERYPRGRGSKADPYRGTDGRVTRSTTVYVLDKLHRWLRGHAAETECSQSDIINEAVSCYRERILNPPKPAYQQWARFRVGGVDHYRRVDLAIPVGDVEAVEIFPPGRSVTWTATTVTTAGPIGGWR